MALALWRSPLARALHRNRSLVYARYAQLATVRADGRPANRTVVFRGFIESTNRLRFIADARSEKIPQILEQPWGELCWYFPNTREQFRLFGSLILVQADCSDLALAKARQAQWQELSDAARSQFAWPDPGQARAAAFDPPPPDPTQPLSSFCLLLLNPVQVDHLELRGEPQNRHVYRPCSDDRQTEDSSEPAQVDSEEPEWWVEAVNP